MHTVYSTRKARKAHHCDVCGPNIQPGDEYEHAVTFDGEVMVWKNCQDCRGPINKASADGYGEYDYGPVTGEDVIEWATEHAGRGGMVDDPDAHALLERIGP